MSKELNIIQAMEMPVGTEFEVCFKDGFQFEEGNKVVIEECEDGNRLAWKACRCDVTCGSNLIAATFIPIQKSVSFMEVVESEKECRVEHKLTVNYRLYNEFNSFQDVMYILSVDFKSEQLREIITEGKWYIEESEDDEIE